jgi:fermentation-respiration switch protein FrsA (DUF1100 family)
VSVLIGAAGLSLGADVPSYWLVVGQLVLIASTVCAITLGYVAGVALALRARAWSGLRAEWHGSGRWPRAGAAGVVLLVAAFLVGYVVFLGVAGSDLWLRAAGPPDCRTPAFMYGWAYEAVNYDAADDLNLQPQNQPDGSWKCPNHGSLAGNEVVTSDGVAIAGWYIAASNGTGPHGPTVVVVPGGKANKSVMLEYLPALHDGYNLLVLDDRGMGRSSGNFSFGLHEPRDVVAMLDWLVREKDPAWIGALGNSLGAGTALAAAKSDPRIRALALDSMQARAETAAGNILKTEWGMPAIPGGWAIIAFASQRLHTDLATVDPLRTISQIGRDRPMLLIHGTADVIDVPEQAVELNFHAAVAAGVPVELRYCLGGEHGKLIDKCQTDWQRWVRRFFDAASARP